MLSPSFPASCVKHDRAPSPDPYERKKYGPHGTQRLGQSRCTRPRRESPLMATTFCHHNKRGVDYMCRCFCNYHSKYKVGTDWHGNCPTPQAVFVVVSLLSLPRSLGSSSCLTTGTEGSRSTGGIIASGPNTGAKSEVSGERGDREGGRIAMQNDQLISTGLHLHAEKTGKCTWKV